MDLRSARVVIRPWRHADEDIADTWPPYHDPFDALWNLPRSISVSQFWSSDYSEGPSRRTWAVEDRHGRLIGRISLREIDNHKRVARLGVTFGAPYVGRGLGTEALELFLDYYFVRLSFEKMVLDVAGPNQRAVRCYERLGFRYVGEDWRSAGPYFDGRALDSPDYAPLRRFFRHGQRELWVQFFEMELCRSEWLERRMREVG